MLYALIGLYDPALSMPGLESQMSTTAKTMHRTFVKVIDLALTTIIHANIKPVRTLYAYAQVQISTSTKNF
jgi:hypothetical protein